MFVDVFSIQRRRKKLICFINSKKNQNEKKKLKKKTKEERNSKGKAMHVRAIMNIFIVFSLWCAYMPHSDYTHILVNWCYLLWEPFLYIEVLEKKIWKRKEAQINIRGCELKHKYVASSQSQMEEQMPLFICTNILKSPGTIYMYYCTLCYIYPIYKDNTKLEVISPCVHIVYKDIYNWLLILLMRVISFQSDCVCINNKWQMKAN